MGPPGGLSEGPPGGLLPRAEFLQSANHTTIVAFEFKESGCLPASPPSGLLQRVELLQTANNTMVVAFEFGVWMPPGGPSQGALRGASRRAPAEG